ncbi:hypothetical protein C8J30_10737 [Rhodobacter viridis]|uniref:Thymidylate synthase n=2 Tax=Rhodobacter viridis TaxID=1054202 RepID=A0A318TY29_9RHOB|nr:hypothetical protein C8J30_10737 [Rhodobacter viridis]
MIRRVWPLAALLAIGACSGPAIISSGGNNGGGGGDTSSIPPELAKNLKSVSFDGETMKVNIEGGDGHPAEVTYERDTRLDVPGYSAYRTQETPLDRLYVALGAISTDGSVQAVTVGDGGVSNVYYAGGSYDRAGGFDAPKTNSADGTVHYAGSYAAVTNVNAPRDGGPDDVALPVSGSVSGSVIPAQPSRVTGDIFLDTNFTDNTVRGSISNRELVDTHTALVDVILVPTSIDPTDDPDTRAGTFSGAAEYADQTVIGTYGGIFGGEGANSVAGVVHLTEFNPNWENEQEHGVFVLTQCGPSNTLPICDNVAP